MIRGVREQLSSNFLFEGHLVNFHPSSATMGQGDTCAKQSSSLGKLGKGKGPLVIGGHVVPICLLTCHGGVDAADVGKKGNFGKLDREGWRLDHLVLEDLGALGRVVEGIDVEVAEIYDGLVGGKVVDEALCTIGEDVVEEVILEILPGQRLGVGTLDWEGLPAQVLRAGWR